MNKVFELTGALLDYWVARAEGLKTPDMVKNECVYVHHEEPGDDGWWTLYNPTEDPALWAPLIEKYDIEISRSRTPTAAWYARTGAKGPPEVGDTPQEAICRAVVRAAFGDEVPGVLNDGGVS